MSKTSCVYVEMDGDEYRCLIKKGYTPGHCIFVDGMTLVKFDIPAEG